VRLHRSRMGLVLRGHRRARDRDQAPAVLDASFAGDERGVRRVRESERVSPGRSDEVPWIWR
jgi:hypothetical protein